MQCFQVESATACPIRQHFRRFDPATPPPWARRGGRAVSPAFLLRSQAGAGTIEIRVARSNGQVEVEFSDDGPGIPADRLGELFEFGFTQKAGRIGLRMGLPSSKRLLQDMGGQISIDSRPGHGTQVRVRLPASAGSAPANNGATA